VKEMYGTNFHLVLIFINEETRIRVANPT
jgi:hypothetical protein